MTELTKQRKEFPDWWIEFLPEIGRTIWPPVTKGEMARFRMIAAKGFEAGRSENAELTACVNQRTIEAQRWSKRWLEEKTRADKAESENAELRKLLSEAFSKPLGGGWSDFDEYVAWQKNVELAIRGGTNV